MIKAATRIPYLPYTVLRTIEHTFKICILKYLHNLWLHLPVIIAMNKVFLFYAINENYMQLITISEKNYFGNFIAGLVFLYYCKYNTLI